MGVGEPPVVADGQPFWVRLRGWAFCTFTLISALLGSIYIITPLLPLLFVNPRCWRKCMDRLVGVWVAMPAALMTYIFGAKVRVRGDLIDHSKPAVIVMNHRSRLDWLYFWNALFTMDPWLCTSEKITLKGVLKFLPGAGLLCALYHPPVSPFYASKSSSRWQSADYNSNSRVLNVRRHCGSNCYISLPS